MTIRRQRINARTRRKLRLSSYRKWLNPVYKSKTVQAIMKAAHKSPNKKEKLLGSLLDEWFPNRFKFVGNGKLILDGKCPDFIDEKNRLLIELYGDWWHKGETEEPRINHFKKLNYDTLVVWEHELEYPKILYNKIKEFVEKGILNDME